MKCPKCGEELPLLSKVCPVCKTVVEREDSSPDAMELSDALDSAVLTIQKAALEVGGVRPGAYMPLYLTVLAVACAMLAVKTSAAILWVVALIVLIAAAVIRRKKHAAAHGKGSVSEALLSFDYGVTLVKRYFGGNREMTKLIDDETEKVDEARGVLDSAKAKNRAVGLGIAAAEAVLLLALVLAVPSAKKAAAERAAAVPEDYDAKVEWYIHKEDPASAVEAYLLSEYNNEFLGADKRVALCISLCRAGYNREAADFVLSKCVGQMNDYDCARAVVAGYLSAGDKASAEAFVSGLSGLKYKSDLKKLKEML